MAGAILQFTIEANRVQAAWFYIALTGAILGSLWLLYRFRLWQIVTSLRTRYNNRLRSRTRLARDLHDYFLQTIQASKLIVDQARETGTDPNQVKDTLDRLSQWLERASVDGQSALNYLQVSENESDDLAAALYRATYQCRVDQNMETYFSVKGTRHSILSSASDEVYQIGVAAIRNACVHSGGSHLEVELRYNEHLLLRVEDNGRGFQERAIVNHRKDGSGIRSMHEWADRIGAQLGIATSGRGTIITLTVPGSKIFEQPSGSLSTSKLVRWFVERGDKSKYLDE